MKRRPFYADIAVFYFCLFVGIWFCGYLYGTDTQAKVECKEKQ